MRSTAGDLALAAAVAGVVAGCGAHAPDAAPARVLPPMEGGASCTLRGRVATRGGDALYGQREGDGAVAIFTGREVEIALTAIASGRERRARATVRAGGVSLRGWIALDAARFYARRELPVIRGVAWIRDGARVRVLAGQGDVLRVEAVYSDFTDLATDVECGVVALERPPGTPDANRVGEPVYAHLARGAVPLYAAPGGAPVVTLLARREGPTVRVLDARNGMRRVEYEEGNRLSGWVREDDLAAGEGPDCDHCYGGGDIPDVWDVCPDAPEDQDGFEDTDGCPEAEPPPARVAAAAATPIRLAPSRDEEAIGEVERGGEVFVVEERDGWGRIAVQGFPVAPPAGRAFWVELAVLRGPMP